MFLMMSWKPGACPIAENQPYGYKHVHTERCLYVSPEQLAARQEKLPQRSWRRRLQSFLSRDGSKVTES